MGPRFSLALWTAIVDAVVLDDPDAWFDDLYFTADEFLAYTFKSCTAFPAESFIFGDIQIFFLRRDSGKLIRHGGFLLAVMLFDGDEFLLIRITRLLFDLSFIKKAELSFDIIRTFFAGFTKEFLGQIVDLFPENLLAFLGIIDHGIQVSDRDVQFLYCVLKLYELLIPGIFCHQHSPLICYIYSTKFCVTKTLVKCRNQRKSLCFTRRIRARVKRCTNDTMAIFKTL